MKKLVTILMALGALAALPVHAQDAPFDSKACMKRCLKVLKEDMDEKNKESKADKEENKGKEEKLDLKEIKRRCGIVCLVNG